MRTTNFVRIACLLVFVILQTLDKADAVAPTMTTALTSFYIGDLETTKRKLGDITYTYAGGDVVTCAVGGITGAPTAATGTEFTVEQDATTLGWELKSATMTYDDATTSVYTVTVECSNSAAETGSQDITVNVVDTAVVGVANGVLQTVNVSALATPSNTAIATVDCSSFDPSHAIEYSIETNPYFQIDLASGAITSKQHLKVVGTNIGAVSYEWYCQDTTDEIRLVNEMLFDFYNQDIPPTTNSLPNTFEIAEDTTSATTIFVLDNEDTDDNTFTYTIDCDPTYLDPMVELVLITDTPTESLAFKLKSGQTFDYETLPALPTCDIYIDDGIVQSAAYTATFNVTDVNEVCVFDSQTYYVTLPEGVAYSSFMDLGLSATDVDAGQSITYDFGTANDSGRFYLDATTGNFSFATNIDCETDGAQIMLELHCIDDGVPSLTGTATLIVNIEDINDNVPEWASSTVVIQVDEDTAEGIVPQDLGVSDKDCSNTSVTCTASSSSAHSGDFLITSACKAYVVNAPTWGVTSVIEYTVTASDNNGSTAVGTVQFFYNPVTTTTVTTTTEEDDFWDDDASVAAFALALAGGLLLLGLITYCIIKYCCLNSGYCCEDCCRSRPHRDRRWRPRRRSFEDRRPETPPRYKKTVDNPYPDVFPQGYNPPAKPMFIQPRPTLIPSRAIYPASALPGYVR